MMKIIVAQKQINLSRLIVFAWSAIGLASCGNKPSKLVADPQPGNNRPSALVSKPQPTKSERTFADWCRQKADLSPETKHTVDVLLKEAGTTDCDAANQKLSLLTDLFLIDNNIGDIKPLASLTNLTVLILIGNKISDIKPLESLTNLKHLVLSNNQISDIKPLESLTNLKELGLNNNQISDIKPLESLTDLTVLNLDSNQIRDIKPLHSLTKLTRLNIMGNPIAPKTCPLNPESICQW
ncbi:MULTISPECIES: leucine-rich repeat domain-containing protein [unclassified Microcoleus]|uniref:leucine-rich repeat domain-containing protein n=1 Tax=unclassified Microcoleus TaxID=2642155 RepID=UPI002FD45EDA